MNQFAFEIADHFWNFLQSHGLGVGCKWNNIFSSACLLPLPIVLVSNASTTLCLWLFNDFYTFWLRAAGEAIFRLFLGVPKSRITSIIKLKQRTEKNSAHVQASRTAKRLASRRSERLFSLESKTIKTSSRPAQAQNLHQALTFESLIKFH